MHTYIYIYTYIHTNCICHHRTWLAVLFVDTSFIVCHALFCRDVFLCCLVFVVPFRTCVCNCWCFSFVCLFVCVCVFVGHLSMQPKWVFTDGHGGHGLSSSLELISASPSPAIIHSPPTPPQCLGSLTIIIIIIMLSSCSRWQWWSSGCMHSNYPLLLSYVIIILSSQLLSPSAYIQRHLWNMERTQPGWPPDLCQRDLDRKNCGANWAP